MFNQPKMSGTNIFGHISLHYSTICAAYESTQMSYNSRVNSAIVNYELRSSVTYEIHTKCQICRPVSDLLSRTEWRSIWWLVYGCSHYQQVYTLCLKKRTNFETV